jgi:undecaprenyl-diphosphatase
MDLGTGSHPLARRSLRARVFGVIERVRALLWSRVRPLADRLLRLRPSNVGAVLPLVAGAAVALAAGFSFLELAERVREGQINELDDAILVWVSERRGPLFTGFFVAITALGSWPVVTLLTVGVCVGTFLAGERRLPTTLALAVTGVPALVAGLKALFGRARPRIVPHLETVATASFPSGHTVASVVLFVTLALLAGGHTRRRRLRVFLVAYSLAIGALVAASRVYLGVHFPSDVLGGGLVGIAWSLCVVVLDRALRGVVK